jgi:hypothetical protein
MLDSSRRHGRLVSLVAGIAGPVIFVLLAAAPRQAVAATYLYIGGTPATTVVAGRGYYFKPWVISPKKTLTYKIRAQPYWASFNTATGALSGGVRSGQVGTYRSIRIGVFDGTSTAWTSAFNITVTATAAPPATTPTPPVTSPPPVTNPTPPVTSPTPPVTSPTPPVTSPTPPVTGPTPSPPTTPVSSPPGTLPAGPGLNFTAAPALSGITTIPNRDSVIVQVPAVANARDFRVLVQPTSVAAGSNGTESVTGGTQFCAGIRQHQSRTRFLADDLTQFPYYFYVNTPYTSPAALSAPHFFATPAASYRVTDLDTPPNLQIEVTGVTAGMTVTVEALDRLCPFPGIIGRQHQDIQLTHSGDVDHPDNPWLDASSVVTFPVVTKAEVAARYGSVIINGQGWAGGPNVQANPPLKPPFAQPAPVNPPVVLARSAITIAPLAAAAPAPAGFFDDFSNSNDIFQPQPVPKWTYPRYPNGGQLILQNSKWTIYANGFTCCGPVSTSDGRGYADAYVEDGTLNTILGDWGQDVLSEVTMVPRKAAHMNATNYLHVTFEVPSFATSRRYWAFTTCGSSVPGQTLDSSGALKEQIVHSTFFYQNTGMSPSTAGWNCLQIFNRQGTSAPGQWENLHNLNGSRPPIPANRGSNDLADYIYTAVPSIANPSTTAAYINHPESDVVVLVNKPIPAANLPEVPGTNDQVAQSSATSPVNVSPLQMDNPAGEIAWFYKVDHQGNPVSPILDDQQLVSPRTKYDLYIRTNRIIMYVNGKAALCNDFTTPSTMLNIADAALGFHQVMYHSSGEFVERFADPDRGAAYHYRYNSPWIDRRNWDNMGFEENTSAPGDFDAATCFVHKSLGPENNEP